MKRSFFLLVVFTAILAPRCAKVYSSPDAKSLAYNHKLVAIAPPKVGIAPGKKVDAEAIQEQQKVESVNFQNEMYSWLLKRKMQNRILVEIQDLSTTNAKLKKAGYYEDQTFTPLQICEILGVDGLITSNFSLSKPMSEGGALALGVLTGVWASTNSTTVSLNIHDKTTNKLIWNYNHKYSGSMGSSPASLVDGLMREASKKMPYSR